MQRERRRRSAGDAAPLKHFWGIGTGIKGGEHLETLVIIMTNKIHKQRRPAGAPKKRKNIRRQTQLAGEMGPKKTQTIMQFGGLQK